MIFSVFSPSLPPSNGSEDLNIAAVVVPLVLVIIISALLIVIIAVVYLTRGNKTYKYSLMLTLIFQCDPPSRDSPLQLQEGRYYFTTGLPTPIIIIVKPDEI